MFRRLPLSFGLVLVLAQGTVHAESGDARHLLIEQGRFWQSKGEPRKAREVWSRILLIDARQADALYGLGLLAVKDDDLKQANEYLVRLQAIQPLPYQALQLKQDIRLADPAKREKLEEARLFADQGEPEKAVSLYRELLGGEPAQGTLGHEYYSTLGFTQGNWSEARAGLERLVRERPDDPHAALLLAKHLAYRQGTRVEGIQALSRLAGRQDVGSDATETWRQALTWLGPPNASLVPLFETFLAANPDDREIRALLAKGRTRTQPGRAAAGRQDSRTAQGLKALERGDLESAERAFSTRLETAPNDADALGGLGVLRQRQERLGEAERLLDKAARQKGGAAWREPLAEVRYWALLQGARDSRAAGDPAGARDRLEQAIRLKPGEPAGHLALADLQAGQGDYPAAEAGYRRVLARNPGDAQARQGLVVVLGQLGRQDEALRLIGELPPAEREKAEFRRLRAGLARQRAREAERRNDAVGQRAALEEAQRLDPENAWTHLDLARLLVREGAADEARRLMDELESRRPDDTDAHYASALLSVESRDWRRAGESLARIPAEARTADSERLADEVDFNRRLQEVRDLGESGRQREARASLAGLEPLAAGRPARTAALAWACADAGEPRRGLDLMRELLARSPASEDARLQAEAAALAVRAGDDAFAGQALRRALALAPDDPAVLADAARIHRQQGRPSRAAELLRKAVALERSQPGTSGPRAEPGEAARTLDEIRQEHSGFLVQGLNVRANDSESGLSKLTDVQMPFEVDIPFGDDRLALRVTPVRLDADSADDDAANRFGDGLLASAAHPGRSPGSQEDNGVGLAIAFENPAEGFKADLGTTPLGFLYSTAVGGISLRRPFAGVPELNWSAQVSRRAVTDSLLSFAGAEDDRTGREWGAVTANGGRLELGYDNRRVGAYAYGSWHRLTGNHVEDNDRAELGAGVYRYLRNEQDHRLSVGLGLTGIVYDENLSHFTYGHGGYFSPQSFLAVGVPVNWARRTERWSVRLRGSLGVQFIDQDAADYFPGDAAMQAEASRILGREARYGSEKSTNIGYSLAGAAEYRLDGHFVVGGHLGMDNSQDWRQWDGGLYLRYRFEDSSRPLDLPVSPYRSPYANY